MTDTTREFGVIGLGNLGGNLTVQALEKRFRVVGYDKREAPKHLLAAGLEAAKGVSEFRHKLTRPRAIFLYPPAGRVVQAIAEGVDLLERYHERLPIADVLRCWSHGSVIRSWLVELMAQAYREKGGLRKNSRLRRRHRRSELAYR